MEVYVGVARCQIRQLRGQRRAVALGRVPLAFERAADAARRREEDLVVRVVVVKGRAEEAPDDGAGDARPALRK